METFLRYLYWISVALVGLCFLVWQVMGAPFTTSWIELGFVTFFFLLCTGFMLERRLKVVVLGRDTFGRRWAADKRLIQALVSNGSREQQARSVEMFVKVVIDGTSDFTHLRPLNSTFETAVHNYCFHEVTSLEKVISSSSSAKERAAAKAKAAKLHSVMQWINQSPAHEGNPIHHAY